MEKDHDNQSHWIELDKRMVIQGLLAERDKETRVYVVTINTPPEYAWNHDRWPRLVRLIAFGVLYNELSGIKSAIRSDLN